MISKSTTPICYLWIAQQSEPGANGKRYAATVTQDSPEAIESVLARPGLVYAESVYDDWELLGTVKGTPFQNSFGDSIIEMATPEMMGTTVAADEVARLGWYSQA